MRIFGLLIFTIVLLSLTACEENTSEDANLDLQTQVLDDGSVAMTEKIPAAHGASNMIIHSSITTTNGVVWEYFTLNTNILLSASMPMVLSFDGLVTNECVVTQRMVSTFFPSFTPLPITNTVYGPASMEGNVGGVIGHASASVWTMTSGHPADMRDYFDVYTNGLISSDEDSNLFHRVGR